jgi:hypothetical protein
MFWLGFSSGLWCGDDDGNDTLLQVVHVCMANHDPDGPMQILFRALDDISTEEELTIRYT